MRRVLLHLNKTDWDNLGKGLDLPAFCYSATKSQ
jgi:hypothetical protein